MTPASPGEESLFRLELKNGVISVGANLSRRELFAAMAMQSFIEKLSNPYKFPYETCADMSCKAADALIDALGQREGCDG